MSRTTVMATAATLALALAGCAYIPVSPEELPDDWTPEPVPSSVPEVIALSQLGFTPGEQAALRVRNDGCHAAGTGTAWAIDAHTAITNKHVVDDFESLEITTHDGRDITVESSYVAKNGDLAFITTVEELMSPVQLASGDPILHQEVTVVGFPQGDGMTTTTGTITGPTSDELDNAETVYGTTAFIMHGSSGSAVYNEDWEVIGVIYAGDGDDDDPSDDADSRGYMVPASILQDFLDDPSLQVRNKKAC